MKRVLLLILLAFPHSLLTQTGSGGLSGTIVDASGAAVSEAKVTVVNEDSGAQVVTLANSEGLYRVPSLLPGSYRVEAAKTGFEKLVRRGLVVTTGQTVLADLTLKIGATSEIVTITESAPLTETQSQSVGQLINRRMVAGLPMPNRAASSLVALAPGVVMIDPGQGAENYPVFSVAGGRGRNQHFSLDGGNATNASGLTRPMQMTSLPMDAMQEFRVISNNYSAEYGHSSGGVISLTTRSGGNDFHGSVFEFLRNSALDARNFFARERPPLRLNQYGFAIGGPIRRNQDALLRFMGTHAASIECHTVVDCSDAGSARGRFFGPAKLGRQHDPHLRSFNDAGSRPPAVSGKSYSDESLRSRFTGGIAILARSEPGGYQHRS